MQEWWTAAEIAEAGLPDLPASKRGVTLLAERDGWQGQAGRARRRQGRGGGWEFHHSLFPSRARAALMRAEAAPAPDTGPEAAPKMSREEAWAAYEALPEAAKARARAKLAAIDAFDSLVAGGDARHQAAALAARIHGASPRSIWNWLDRLDGVRRDDRLAWLAPRHRMAARKGTRRAMQAHCDPEAWDVFLADYLRVEQPSLSSCYRRAAAFAAREGWALPDERSVRRRLAREISRPALVLARQGMDALKRMYPPQMRDKSGLHAMECVNADGHRWDVAVRWEDGTIGRPVMIGFQDVYSGRMLSWRIDRSENRIAVLLALGEMVEDFGIPDHCVLDNGRNFATKWLSGGVPTRYRFKVRADEPLGVLPQLGIRLHWTIPYSGQSKPIERAWRDFCDAIAKHPRFAGAWMGNRPDAKPENYGSHAVPIDEFQAVVAEGIAEHNARRGRRSSICGGRSFAEVFDESYAAAPIRRATAAQRRLWLMGVEALTVHREHGGLSFMENRYWAEFLTGLAGQRVAARFDPLRLQDGLHVYALDGRYLGHALCHEKAGFLSLSDAQSHARAKRQFVRAVQDQRKAATRMNLIEATARMVGDEASDTPPPPSKVVRPVFRGSAALALAPDHRDESAPEIDSDAAWAASVAGIHRLYGPDE